MLPRDHPESSHGILRAAGVLPAGVDVITVQVDDVPMAGADEGRMRLVAALA